MTNGTVRNFGTGVEVQANNANLSALLATVNGTGVHFFNAQGGMLLTSQTSGNGLYGVYLEDSQNIRVVDNTIINNGTDGVWLQSSSGNTISFNSSVSSNGYAGILVAAAPSLGKPPPLPAATCPPVIITGPVGFSDLVPTASQNNLIFGNSGSKILVNAVLGIGLQCGAALSNTVEANANVDGGTWGGYDGNLNCDANSWSDDTFNSVNQACVK